MRFPFGNMRTSCKPSPRGVISPRCFCPRGISVEGRIRAVRTQPESCSEIVSSSLRQPRCTIQASSRCATPTGGRGGRNCAAMRIAVLPSSALKGKRPNDAHSKVPTSSLTLQKVHFTTSLGSSLKYVRAKLWIPLTRRRGRLEERNASRHMFGYNRSWQRFLPTAQSASSNALIIQPWFEANAIP